MNTTIAIRLARMPRSPDWLVGLLLIAAMILCPPQAALATTADPLTADPLFDAPPRATVSDEVILLSTRSIGMACDTQSMCQGLQCHRLDTGPAATSPLGREPAQAALPRRSATWKPTDWRRLLARHDQRPIILYVHGNRVATGRDRTQGLSVYRSLKAHCQTTGPIRFVIWSWPAEPIAGPIKDYVVKARRTNPAAWQLAWLLDKLPLETEISLVGYSYGTRVVSGATHLLAGGRIGNLQLIERVHSQRPPLRAALLAAAYDADWVQPGKFYSHSLAQIERLIVTTNQRDPVMRFYHLSNGRGRMHALGKSGVAQPSALGCAVRALQRVDFTCEVGRSHALIDYLAAGIKMSDFWDRLTRSSDRPTVPSWFAQRAVGDAVP